MTAPTVAAPMALERATEIVQACYLHVLYEFGVVDQRPPSLEGYTLRELVEASHVVQVDNRERCTQPGPHSVQVTCDDRLIAALYVAYHYPAQVPAAEPVCIANGRGVLVIEAER